MRTLGEIAEETRVNQESIPLWLVRTEVEGFEKICYLITGKKTDESHVDYYVHLYNGVLV